MRTFTSSVLIGLLLLVGFAAPANAGAPAGSPCGFTAGDPGGDGTDGYALRSGYTAMDHSYAYRVVAGSPSWMEEDVDFAIGQANSVTGAHLVHGPDVQYMGDLSLMNAGDHEIWVFSNTPATRGARPPGTWTYTNVHGGRTSDGWISLDPNLPSPVRHKSLLHELGHSLGLDHYFWPYQGQCQVMSYGEPNLNSYRAGDINGLRVLAGLPPSSPPAPGHSTPAPKDPYPHAAVPRAIPVVPVVPPVPSAPSPAYGPKRADAVLEALRHLSQ